MDYCCVLGCGTWWDWIALEVNYVLFRVDRIDGDVRVGPADSFQRPDGFDIRSVFPADPKLLGESEGEPALALVRIFASRATLVIARARPWRCSSPTS